MLSGGRDRRACDRRPDDAPLLRRRHTAATSSEQSLTTLSYDGGMSTVSDVARRQTSPTLDVGQPPKSSPKTPLAAPAAGRNEATSLVMVMSANVGNRRLCDVERMCLRRRQMTRAISSTIISSTREPPNTMLTIMLTFGIDADAETHHRQVCELFLEVALCRLCTTSHPDGIKTEHMSSGAD